MKITILMILIAVLSSAVANAGTKYQKVNRWYKGQKPDQFWAFEKAKPAPCPQLPALTSEDLREEELEEEMTASFWDTNWEDTID